jgi:16S rRNA (uracil1498-N3)-methyltransferase
VFVGDLAAPVLAQGDEHHLRKSLRLRPGDPLAVSDGRGRWCPVRFGGELVPQGPVVEVPRPRPVLTVGFTPTKGHRPEWAVQKLTELAVDRILVLHTDRSVVVWPGDRAAAHLDRLRRIAREAAMQSRRVWLPEVVGVQAPSAYPTAALADPGGRPPAAGDTTVLCGPEGGWSDEERRAAPARIGLGPGVLRAETAAVTAGALLAALRHGLVRPA